MSVLARTFLLITACSFLQYAEASVSCMGGMWECPVCCPDHFWKVGECCDLFQAGKNAVNEVVSDVANGVQQVIDGQSSQSSGYQHTSTYVTESGPFPYWIIGVAVGGLVALVAVILLCCCCCACCRRRKLVVVTTQNYYPLNNDVNGAQAQPEQKY